MILLNSEEELMYDLWRMKKATNETLSKHQLKHVLELGLEQEKILAVATKSVKVEVKVEESPQSGATSKGMGKRGKRKTNYEDQDVKIPAKKIKKEPGVGGGREAAPRPGARAPAPPPPVTNHWLLTTGY